ncbi:hypothetical protein, partial [Brucella anthropi]|uniref:hypothetical protein n=1 Tax=Brucella anthropi TaxID=529 RepID=UPI003F739CBE
MRAGFNPLPASIRHAMMLWIADAYLIRANSATVEWSTHSPRVPPNPSSISIRLAKVMRAFNWPIASARYFVSAIID